MTPEKLEECPACHMDGDYWNYDFQVCSLCAPEGLTPAQAAMARELGAALGQMDQAMRHFTSAQASMIQAAQALMRSSRILADEQRAAMRRPRGNGTHDVHTAKSSPVAIGNP